MIVPRVFKSRQRKRKNISIVLSSQKVSRIFLGTFSFCLQLPARERRERYRPSVCAALPRFPNKSRKSRHTCAGKANISRRKCQKKKRQVSSNAVIVLSSFVFLCRIDRRDQHPFNFCALIEQCCFFIIPALHKQFYPIFALGTFLESNLKLSDKIGFTVGIKGFSDISADTCSATQKLINKRTFTFYRSQFFANSYYIKRKCFRFYQ